MTVDPWPEPSAGDLEAAETPQRIKVLIVDDHLAVREGLRSMLGREPDMDVVAEAVDGREALHQVEAAAPDMVLMDIFMPGMGGIEATRAIKARWPKVRVLVFTVIDAPSLVLRALAAGADGYLLKDAPSRTLVSAIRTVAGGDFVIKGELWRLLLPHLNQ